MPKNNFKTAITKLSLWKNLSGFLLVGSFILLFLVLVPGVGKVVNGSARWIDVGIFNLQPSELAKIFIVIYLASYLDRHLIEVREQWSGFLKPLLIVALAAILLQTKESKPLVCSFHGRSISSGAFRYV